MRYIGGKGKIIGTVTDAVKAAFPGAVTVCDPFCGSLAASEGFAAAGYRTVSSDALLFPCVLASGEERQMKDGRRKAEEALDVLREAAPVHGVLTERFSPAGKYGRMYLTAENAEKADGMRLRAAEEYGKDGDTGLYMLRMSALLRGISASANIMGTYGAYAKKFSPRAAKPIVPVLPEAAYAAAENGGSITAAAPRTAAKACREKTDLLYADPPYTARHYAPNYHLPETAARMPGEEGPEPCGITGTHGCAFSSDPDGGWFTEKGAEESLAGLLRLSGAGYFCMSYSTDGLMTEDTVLRILSAYACGKPEVIRIPHRRYGRQKDGFSELLFLAVLLPAEERRNICFRGKEKH